MIKKFAILICTVLVGCGGGSSSGGGQSALFAVTGFYRGTTDVQIIIEGIASQPANREIQFEVTGNEAGSQRITIFFFNSVGVLTALRSDLSFRASLGNVEATTTNGDRCRGRLDFEGQLNPTTQLVNGSIGGTLQCDGITPLATARGAFSARFGG